MKQWLLLQLVQKYKILAFCLVMITGLASYGKFSELDSPDFKVFYVAAQHAANSPETIYTDSPDRFLYPPPAAFFFTPFLLLPDWNTSKHAWFLISLALLFWVSRQSPFALLASLFLLRYFVINLRYGQVNLLILCAILLCSSQWQKRKTKGDFLGGVGLALTGILKLFPFLQTLEPIARRRWRSLAFSFGSGILVMLLPFLFWGWETTIALYASYPSQLESKGIPIYTHNQSFLALLYRLFGGEEFYSFAVGAANWTITTIPKSSLKLVATALGMTIAAVAWWKSYRRQSTIDFASATVFSFLFLSHIVWKPYFIFLLPPLWQVLSSKKTRFQTVALILCLVLGPLSSPDIWGVPTSRIFEAASTHLISAFVLFILWLQIKIEKREETV